MSAPLSLPCLHFVDERLSLTLPNAAQLIAVPHDCPRRARLHRAQHLSDDFLPSSHIHIAIEEMHCSRMRIANRNDPAVPMPHDGRIRPDEVIQAKCAEMENRVADQVIIGQPPVLHRQLGRMLIFLLDAR